MKLLYLFIATICCVSLQLARADEAPETAGRKDISEEMQLINKSLDGLLNELAAIKREATGRLAQVKKATGATAAETNQNDMERIRQQKVSRFVLKRVAELETESLGMRDEMAKLFEISKKAEARLDSRQEDHDFEEPASTTNKLPATTQTAAAPPSSTATATATTTTSTTLKPDEQEEADKIGFDLEQLKRLGEEIGKRLDQFGKDAAKNLGELVEGIKLVFREPKGKNSSAKGDRFVLKLVQVDSWQPTASPQATNSMPS